MEEKLARITGALVGVTVALLLVILGTEYRHWRKHQVMELRYQRLEVAIKDHRDVIHRMLMQRAGQRPRMAPSAPKSNPTTADAP